MTKDITEQLEKELKETDNLESFLEKIEVIQEDLEELRRKVLKQIRGEND